MWTRVEGKEATKSVAKTINHYMTDIQRVLHKDLSFKIVVHLLPTFPDTPGNPPGTQTGHLQFPLPFHECHVTYPKP